MGIAGLYGIIAGMRTTIDAAGRVVIPKPLRQWAGLEAGVEIEVRAVGDVLELRPATRPVRLERRGDFVVAVPLEDGPTLHQREVDETLAALRERRDAPSEP